MKQIILDDGNDNIQCLQEMFDIIASKHNEGIIWKISEFDAVPINDDVDYSGIGIEIKTCRDIVYEFQQKIIRDHAVKIGQIELLDLLNSIRTVYDAVFKTIINNEQCEIVIFDGEIVKIIGEIESYFD